jgi:molybdate transport system substrate-binding protein
VLGKEPELSCLPLARRVAPPTSRWCAPHKTAFVLLLLVVTLALAALGAAAGCGSVPAESPSPTVTGVTGDVMVFAAASLTEAFTRLGKDFEAANPGARVTFNFAGSQALASQLQEGAAADVLATADTKNMDKVADLVEAPVVFVANKLTIAVAPGNPKGVRSLADLARADLKVVLCAAEVPAGKYAAQVLEKAGDTVSPVSLEDNVKGALAKVEFGEADAAIVYVTDVEAAGDKADAVAIPDDQNVIATYPMAVVKASQHAEGAQAFLDLVMSTGGQAVLASYGFLPAPAE